MNERNNLQENTSPNQTMQPEIKGRYQFSPEEMRVLKECNTESFYKRSMPFSTILGAGTFYAVRSGYLAGNIRYGAVPKVLGAVCIGYFLGKISYQATCATKLMELPNSQLGQLLRQKKNQTFGTLTPSLGGQVSMYGATSSDVYSDDERASPLNLDTDRPTFAGLAERTDSELKGSGETQSYLPKTPDLSYDELRVKNRNDHNSSRSQPYKLEENAPPIVRSRPAPEAKNKYGDSLD